MAVPVGRISQGAAVFCVRNASTSRVVRSMPSRSTSRHFCDATRCRRRCSTTISTGAGSSRRRRSGASARNGDANALHARLRRDGSSVVSVALEPTACSSARLELPPEVVSGSVLVASAQFVGARCFDVAAPRFEARPSRRRRRKDAPLHTLALLGVDPAECAARTYRVLTLNRRTSAMLTNSLASHV